MFTGFVVAAVLLVAEVEVVEVVEVEVEIEVDVVAVVEEVRQDFATWLWVKKKTSRNRRFWKPFSLYQ